MEDVILLPDGKLGVYDLESQVVHPKNVHETPITIDSQFMDNHSIISEISTPYRNVHEEPWSEKSEKMMLKWRKQIDKLTEMQEKAGYYIKARYHYLSIPAITIPFLMTFLSQSVPIYTDESREAINITNGIMFMLTSIFTGLLAFFNYGQLYEKHFSFAARYQDLSGRIETVLTSNRKFRTPVDVFTTEIKCKLDSLNENSPKIPMSILKNG